MPPKGRPSSSSFRTLTVGCAISHPAPATRQRPRGLNTTDRESHPSLKMTSIIIAHPSLPNVCCHRLFRVPAATMAKVFFAPLSHRNQRRRTPRPAEAMPPFYALIPPLRRNAHSVSPIFLRHMGETTAQFRPLSTLTFAHLQNLNLSSFSPLSPQPH